MGLRLRERDMALLEALALRVRILGQRQAADAFWDGHIPNARRRLRRLVDDGLLKKLIVPARPLPAMREPVVRWKPGMPIPNAGRISFQLQNRWRFRALRPTVVYLPTITTVVRFGGMYRGNLLATHATHDLGVTAAWIRYYMEGTQQAANWIGEELLAPSRINQKLPDAALLDSQGEPCLLVEFGGCYSTERVAVFHDDAAFRNLPYHLW